MSERMNIFTQIGARNYAQTERQSDDYYATESKAVIELLKVENFSHKIWEPACGGGHISEVLKRYGHEVYSTDLIYRGYAEQQDTFDFLKVNYEPDNIDIITNPPYKSAIEFIEKALECVTKGHKVAMLLKLQFLEGQKRRKLFDKYPPYKVYVFSKRVQCAKNGDFEKYKKGVGTAIAYVWVVWKKGYAGNTILKWIN